MNRIRILAHLVVGLAVAAPPLAAQSHAREYTIVYLVRHAERTNDGTADPPLSPEGEKRARLLAQMLRDAGIGYVHATPYERTRATAAPLAERLGLSVDTYHGSDLAGLASRIRAAGGRHLVVGHSNTTPAAVAALGGEPGDPIGEDEHDRLYVLTIDDGGTSTVLLRFGSPTPDP
jgi:broad specificity phosphatase PhoE